MSFPDAGARASPPATPPPSAGTGPPAAPGPPSDSTRTPTPGAPSEPPQADEQDTACLGPRARPSPVVATLVPRAGRRAAGQLVLGVLLFFLAEMVMSLVAFAISPSATSAPATSVPGSATASGSATAGVTAEMPGPVGLFVGAAVGATIAMGGYLLLVGPIGRRSAQGLRGKGAAKELALGLAVGATLIGVSIAVISALGGYRVTGVDTSPELLAPLGIATGAGFIEEVFFRGILLRVLDSWLGSWWALAITAVLFGAIHLTNPGAGPLDGIILVLEAGLLLGAAYLVTRRLWLPIGIHVAWNFTESCIFSSDVSGTGRQHGLLAAAFHGPDWLTGGAMGLEGSWVTAGVCVACGIALLITAHRRGSILAASRTQPWRVQV